AGLTSGPDRNASSPSGPRLLRVVHLGRLVRLLERGLVLGEEGADPLELALDRGAVVGVRREVEEERGHGLGAHLEAVVADLRERVRLHLVGVVRRLRGLDREADAWAAARHAARLLVPLGLARLRLDSPPAQRP